MADGLRLEPAGRPAGELTIMGSSRFMLAVRLPTDSPIDGTGHDQLVDQLEPSSRCGSAHGRGNRATRDASADRPAGAEIVGGADDAAAHVMLPQAIDDDAGQQVAGAHGGRR